MLTLESRDMEKGSRYFVSKRDLMSPLRGHRSASSSLSLRVCVKRTAAVLTRMLGASAVRPRSSDLPLKTKDVTKKDKRKCYS